MIKIELQIQFPIFFLITLFSTYSITHYNMAYFATSGARFLPCHLNKGVLHNGLYVLHVHSQADAPSIERILKAQVEKIKSILLQVLNYRSRIQLYF